MNKREWILQITHDRVRIENLNAVQWWRAPKPGRWHLCRTQTRGYLPHLFMAIERCACGAIKLNGGRWKNRNSR